MPLLDSDLAIARKVFDVNVFGVIGTIQVFSSLLIAAKGTIVIIGSVGGVLSYPFGGSHFHVHVMAPGFTFTLVFLGL